MGWLDDLKKAIDKVPEGLSDAGDAIESQKIPGLGTVGQVGGEVSSWVKQNAPTFERYADAPGQAAVAPETLPGSAAPKTGPLSPYPNAFDIGKGVQNIAGGGGKKKTQAATDPPPQPTGTAPPTQQSPDDALTAGLGMFFSQYLAPMMQQINSQNNGMINQWGNTMNQLLQQPLPAGVKAIMQPWVAQNAQTLGMINTAAADQVAGQIPFNTLMNQLGQASAGQQALASALPTAAADQALASGNSQAVGQMLANMGVANTPVSAGVLSLLSQPSTLQALTQGGKGSTSGSSSSGTSSPQSVTPIQVLPSQQQTTPSTAPTAASQTNDLSNTLYAQQLAQAMLAAQQPSASAANAQAGAGYTP